MALFKSITIGQYIPGNSTIHRLDPRTKIIGTVLLIVLLFMVDTFWGYALAALAIAAIVHLSGDSTPIGFAGTAASVCHSAPHCVTASLHD